MGNAVVWAALLIVSIREVELLLRKSASPAYIAEMVWLPRLSEEMVNVATPVPVSVAVPRTVVESLNVTLPVGVPDPGALTWIVAVNVTMCPTTAGFVEELTAAVVPALLTISP